jgi:hypothetical protein
MSTPTALPPAVLSGLAPVAAGGTGRHPRAGLARAALFLTAVPLAVAASGPLAGAPWPVPTGAAGLGWGALLGLSYLGRVAAGRDGVRSAARLVLAGFGALGLAWSGLLALAPASLAGPDRAAGYAASLPVLVLLASFTAGLATGAVPALLRWSVPGLLVAGAGIAGWLPAAGLPVPPGRLLLAAVGLLAVRAFWPALTWRAGRRPPRARPARDRPPRARPARRWRPRIDGSELRRGAGHLALGLSQAAAVLVVWRAGAPVAPGGVAPALLPVLVALPAAEVWVGWHRARVAAGLARYDDRTAHQRYARRVAWATLAALLPPLVAGAALAGTAHRLPSWLSAHPDAPALVLSMASGVLLAGLLALGSLLATRDRPGPAAAVTGGAVAGGLVLAASVPGLAATSLSGWGPLLPATVVALATAYLAGLILASHVLFDSRSAD